MPVEARDTADIISEDECYMSLAYIISKRSKDPVTQVGAVIVSEHDQVIAIGYNKLPTGLDETKYSWDKKKGTLDDKQLYVIHAEAVAISNCVRPLKGCSIYVTLQPCNECTKLIIQSGIREIIVLEEKMKKSVKYQAAEKMLFDTNITYRTFEGFLPIKYTKDTLL